MGAAGNGAIPVIKLTPQMREVSSGYSINTVNIDFYRMFMSYPQIIPIKESLKAPKLIEGPENRVLYNKGDRVYTYGLEKPGKYYTYRFTKDITDPDTNKQLGREIMISGIVSTQSTTSTALEHRSAQDKKELPDDEYYTRLHPLVKVPTYSAQPLVVEQSVSEISQGDFLMPIENGNNNSMTIMPHAPSKPVLAKVVSIVDGIIESGPFQTITLNKGLVDGLDVGSVVSLYKKSRKIKPGYNIKTNKDGEKNSTATIKYLSIPSEEVALAMIYRSYDNLSYAIIMESVTNVNIGDIAREPGMDRDDVVMDSKIVPNKAEDPAGWKEQFNSTDPYNHTNMKVTDVKKL
jgi:nucleoid-associated protein YgaU